LPLGLASLHETIDENVSGRRLRNRASGQIGAERCDDFDRIFVARPGRLRPTLVAGDGNAGQASARLFAYRDPENFVRLIDRLVQGSIEYLVGQLKAGAEVVQIFDTWAGVLPPEQFERWCIEPTRAIVAGVRAQIPDAKIIGFTRGASAMALPYVVATGIDAIGLDCTFPRSLARDILQRRVAVQGNVDPLALLAGGAALDREVDDVMATLAGGPLIFNLGHGILPGNAGRACGADAEKGGERDVIGVRNRTRHGQKFFRIVNEIPTVWMIALLAVVKPF